MQQIKFRHSKHLMHLRVALKESLQLFEDQHHPLVDAVLILERVLLQEREKKRYVSAWRRVRG
jgi:hypothetical protein